MTASLDKILDEYVDNQESLLADAHADIEIDPERLLSHLTSHPGTFLKWGMLQALAEARLRDIKREIEERIWPTARDEARAQILASGDKVTEARTDDLAVRNTKYQEAASKRALLAKVVDMLTKIENAMYVKRDSLQALSNRSREEFHSYLSSKE